MKKLFILLALFTILSGCNKDNKREDYIITATGSDYSDELYLVYQLKGVPNKIFDFNNGEAFFEAMRVDVLTVLYRKHSNDSSGYSDAPLNQTDGDTVHLEVYKKKRNGSKGDKVGEVDIICSSLYIEGEGMGTVKLNW